MIGIHKLFSFGKVTFKEFVSTFLLVRAVSLMRQYRNRFYSNADHTSKVS